MKIFFISVLSFIEIFANSSVKNIVINHHDFRFLELSFQEYSEKGKVLKIYDANDTKYKNPLVHFILEDIQGGCSGKSIQKGSYTIEGSKIIFYSHWSRTGKERLSPYGARIMKYKVNAKGDFQKLSSRLYIEEHKLEKDEDSGMQYLFKTPKSEAQKRQFQKYTAWVEKRYAGVFLFNQEAKRLIEEVSQAIKKKMKRRWGEAIE